jgi:hypothetical protein
MTLHRTLARVTRLRWRLRGATMWPAFFVVVVAGAVFLDRGTVASVLLAAAGALIVVAALAPLAGLALRRLRPDLPRAIATDYAGTTLLVLLLAAFIVSGLLHRAQARRDRRDLAASYAATSTYVHSQAREFLPGLDRMDAIKVEPGMYRTCVPAGRPLCLFVDVDQSPPGVTRDPERLPNSLWRR